MSLLTRQDQIVDRFERFHRANPDIWHLFERFALQAAGVRDHYSARAIVHRIRWEVAIETHGDLVKINDHFSPYYGRLFSLAYPGIDLFEPRKLKSAERPACEDDVSVFIDDPAGDEVLLTARLGELLKADD